MPRRKKTNKPVVQTWAEYCVLCRLRDNGNSCDSILSELHAFCVETIILPIITNRSGRRNSSRRKAGTSGNFRYVAYRFQGLPDSDQEVFLRKNVGSSRWMWNRLKSDSDRYFQETGKLPRNTPASYKQMDGLEWLREVDSYALCNVQLQFESARSDWLNGTKGQPRFKKKRLCTDSYTTNRKPGTDNLYFDELHALLTLPKLGTPVRLRMHRKINPGGVLKNCTVTHEADGRWYFSLVYEYPLNERMQFSPGLEEFLETGDLDAIRHIGLDMSLPHMYIDSNGNQPGYTLNDVEVRFTRPYRRLEKKLAREQRRLSKMVKGSGHYERQCEKIASLHAKAKHQRNDFLHQVAVRLARAYDIISVEDLDMSAMKQALRFGKSVSDIGWGTFLSILEEKCLEYGSILIRVDKWFPSSKTCSHCGKVHKELKLSDREFVCPHCGHAMNRDTQAAQNIDQEGLRMVLNYLTPNNVKSA